MSHADGHNAYRAELIETGAKTTTCRAAGVSGLRMASCTEAVVKIAPSGCNQSEEGGREGAGGRA